MSLLARSGNGVQVRAEEPSVHTTNGCRKGSIFGSCARGETTARWQTGRVFLVLSCYKQVGEMPASGPNVHNKTSSISTRRYLTVQHVRTRASTGQQKLERRATILPMKVPYVGPRKFNGLQVCALHGIPPTTQYVRGTGCTGNSAVSHVLWVF